LSKEKEIVLNSGDRVKIDGLSDTGQFAVNALSQYGWDIPTTLKEISNPAYANEYTKRVSDLISHWNEYGGGIKEVNSPTGGVYKVDLAPNLEDFLHRDLPLSEQSPRIQQIISSLLPSKERSEEIMSRSEELAGKALAANPDVTKWDGSHPDQQAWEAFSSLPEYRLARLVQLQSRPEWGTGIMLDQTRGHQFYDALPGTPAERSAALLQAGIPGLAYLDSGSRAAGTGSHNYVMFDDKGIKILEKNGQPVSSLFQQ
jgi:hypothetical protein